MQSKPTVEQALFTMGFLLDLDIGRWSGTKKLQESDMLLSDVDPDAINLGHKKLIPREATKKLVSIEARARNTLARFSTDFPIAGARFVTYKAVGLLIEKLEEAKKEYEIEIEKFLEEYPQLRAKQLQLLSNQCDAFAREELKKAPDAQKQNRFIELMEWIQAQEEINRSLYPEKEELRKKYRFRWCTFKIDAAGPSKASGSFEEDLKSWVKESTVNNYEQLGATVAHTKSVLEGKKEIKPKNLKGLLDAIKIFDAVDLSGGSEICPVVEALVKLTTLSDEMFQHEWDSGRVLVLLDALAKLANSNRAEEVAVKSLSSPNGVFARVLDLD